MNKLSYSWQNLSVQKECILMLKIDTVSPWFSFKRLFPSLTFLAYTTGCQTFMTAYNGKTILLLVNNVTYEYILTAFSLQICCRHNTKQIAFNMLELSGELKKFKTNLWHQVLNAECNENANLDASAEYTLCKIIQFIQLIN